MTPTQIELVQTSFLKVAEIQEKAAELFYTNLFELDGDLRKLFKEDMNEQKRKLMKSLAYIVNGLDRLESRRSYIEGLGKVHVGYGVGPEDYDTVGKALLSTLEAAFGEDWTPDLADAWAAAYGGLAGLMIGVGYPESGSAQRAS